MARRLAGVLRQHPEEAERHPLTRLEGIVDRVERMVDVAESLMSPVAATESAVRGCSASLDASDGVPA